MPGADPRLRATLNTSPANRASDGEKKTQMLGTSSQSGAVAGQPAAWRWGGCFQGVPNGLNASDRTVCCNEVSLPPVSIGEWHNSSVKCRHSGSHCAQHRITKQPLPASNVSSHAPDHGNRHNAACPGAISKLGHINQQFSVRIAASPDAAATPPTPRRRWLPSKPLRSPWMVRRLNPVTSD